MAASRAPARTFQDLIVWRKAHDFVLLVYRFTAAFPKQETYGLCSRMRQAAVSIAGNIAEGFRRFGRADKVRFMNIAEASLEESRYYLILSRDLVYGNPQELMPLLEETSRLLHNCTKEIRVATGSHSDS